MRGLFTLAVQSCPEKEKFRKVIVGAYEVREVGSQSEVDN
jgi:hypothetical protein